MADIKKHVKLNQIKNCDVAVDDVVRVDFFGKVVPELKGKLKRVVHEAHSKTHRQPLSTTFENLLLHLFMYVLCVNKTPFFISKTRDINSIVFHPLKSRSATQLNNAVVDHIEKCEL